MIYFFSICCTIAQKIKCSCYYIHQEAVLKHWPFDYLWERLSKAYWADMNHVKFEPSENSLYFQTEQNCSLEFICFNKIKFLLA